MITRDVILLIPMLFILPPYLGVNGVWLAQPLSTVLAFFMILTISFRQIRSYLKQENHIKKRPRQSLLPGR
jgi:Na+-driven multidrug efflux pump